MKLSKVHDSRLGARQQEEERGFGAQAQQPVDTAAILRSQRTVNAKLKLTHNGVETALSGITLSFRIAFVDGILELVPVCQAAKLVS